MFTVLPAQAKITGVVEMSDVEDLLATGQGPYAPPAISGTCPLPHAGASSCKACVNNLVCRHKLGDIIPAADGEIPDAVPADAEIEKALTIESPDPAGAVPKEGRWAGPFPLGEAEFERLLALESGLDPEMETRQLSKGVSVEGTNIYLGKATGEVEAPAAVVMQLLWDFGVRRKWDSFFIEQVVLEQVSPAREFVYFTGKTPPFVTRRDFVQARALRVSPGRDLFSSVYVSVTHPAMPERKGFLRGHVFFSGFVVRSITPARCRVSMITHTDFKGWIPAWVINQMTGMVALSWVENLRKAADKMRPRLSTTAWPDFATC